MKRLLATTRLDVMVQLRSKLYHVAIGMAILLGIAIRLLFPPETIGTVLPVFYLLSVGGTAYLFVAGMVIFEKGEDTLAAQIVSPLRKSEYLAANAVSLLLVVLIESTLVLLIAAGVSGYDPVSLFAELTLISLGLTLGGFIQVSRYRTVTDFLVPAVAVTLILQLPFVHFLEIAPSRLWYIVPTTAPALLMFAAFEPIATWEWVYAIGYSLLAIGLLAWWARRSFYRNVILRGL